MDKSKALAQRSLHHAEKAGKLSPSKAFEKVVLQQTRKARLLFTSFDQPASSLQLWIDAVIQDDRPLASFLYDGSRAMSQVFGESRDSMTDQDWKRLEQAFFLSYGRTVERYRDVVSTMKAEEMETFFSSEGASVRCKFQLMGKPIDLTYWLHHDMDIWRLYDFSIWEDKGSQVFRDLLSQMDADVDLVNFLEGKCIFEAFSEIQDAQRFGPLFQKKPWIGNHVRLKVPVLLARFGKDEPVEEDRILKVIDQGADDSGSGYLVVRTTEADPTQSAMGQIPAESVENLGSEEGEVWGLSLESMQGGSE